MIRKTISKELKELFRDGRVRLAGIIVLLLLGVAVWISSSQYKRTKQQYETAQKTERAVWDNQGEKNPHSAAHYGTYAFKPEYPLGLLDKGIDKYSGTSIFMEAHKRNEAQYSPVADQTGLARFGELTPDFILLFIIPLFIILMGYNSYTKEAELGTLPLLKSQGAKGWKILLGKWIALFLPIASVTLLLFLIAGWMLRGMKEFENFSWASLGVLLLVYLVYYAIFINIVLLISRLAKRSGIALVGLLSIWILACLAVPKAAGNLADAKYPYPTRQEFNAAVLEDKKEGLDGHNPWSEEAKRLEKQTLAEYGVDSLHQLPFNYDAYRMQKGEEHEAEVYRKHYGKLREQFSNQAATYRNLSVLSPFLSTRFLSMGIARTDYYTHWDFADAAEDYRIATQKFLNDEFAQNSGYGDWGYKSDADTWKQLPEFEYHPLPLRTVLQQQQSALWILAGWLAGTLALLFNLRNKL
ncbi:ABC transporter permease [Sinomicrobium sp. M5D2P9]